MLLKLFKKLICTTLLGFLTASVNGSNTFQEMKSFEQQKASCRASLGEYKAASSFKAFSMDLSKLDNLLKAEDERVKEVENFRYFIEGCIEGRLDRVKQILEEYPHFVDRQDSKTKGLTCLMHACQAGRMDIVRHLLEEHKANTLVSVEPSKDILNETSLYRHRNSRFSAVHFAIAHNRREIVRYLFEKNPNTSSHDVSLANPYDLTWDKPDILHLFIQLGVPIRGFPHLPKLLVSVGFKGTLRFAIFERMLLAITDHFGPENFSLLHLAVLSGRVSMIRCLLEMGVVVDAVDASGMTAVHYAAMMLDNSAVLKTILTHSPKMINSTAKDSGRVPLECFVDAVVDHQRATNPPLNNGILEVAKVFIDFKADPLRRNERRDGSTSMSPFEKLLLHSNGGNPAVKVMIDQLVAQGLYSDLRSCILRVVKPACLSQHFALIKSDDAREVQCFICRKSKVDVALSGTHYCHSSCFGFDRSIIEMGLDPSKDAAIITDRKVDFSREAFENFTLACQCGRGNVVEKLASQFPRFLQMPISSDPTFTCLNAVISGGHYGIARLLLKRFKVQADSESLQRAVSCNRPEMIELLMELDGGSLKKELSQCLSIKILIRSIELDYPDVFSTLLDNLKRIDPSVVIKKTLLYRIIMRNFSAGILESSIKNALLGTRDLVDGESGASALHILCSAPSSWKQQSMIKTCLRLGVKPGLQTLKSGATALHFAAKNCNYRAINLVCKGAAGEEMKDLLINAPDFKGQTPLHYMMHGSERHAIPPIALQALFDNGANPLALDQIGASPFILASRLFHTPDYYSAMLICQIIHNVSSSELKDEDAKEFNIKSILTKQLIPALLLEKNERIAALVASALPSFEETGCAICFDADVDVMLIPCNHLFHHECIYKWQHAGRSASKTCPVCRQTIDAVLNVPPPYSKQHQVCIGMQSALLSPSLVRSRAS